MSRKIILKVLPTPEKRTQDGELVACTECGKCCTYIGVGINTPRSQRYATDILWYLYHENIEVRLDGDGEWSVMFESRCRNLQDDLFCAVYANRPHICREFDNTGCEVNAPDNDDRIFRTPAEFLEYLQERRPKLYAKLQKTYVLGAHAPKPAKARVRAKKKNASRRTRPAARTSRPSRPGG